MLALISVSDRRGVTDFGRALRAMGWKLISSGGTAEALRASGIAVTPVAEFTGSPEILGGRVKTMHPRIHGGILADRGRSDHLGDLAEVGASPIDLVVCNLYPFAELPSVEMIDIGGPAMLRAAAKNFAHVGVVVDASDYEMVITELSKGGRLGEEVRLRLAQKAFEHCAAYDAAVAAWLRKGQRGATAATVSTGSVGESSSAPSSSHLSLSALSSSAPSSRQERESSFEDSQPVEGEARNFLADGLPEKLQLNLRRKQLLRYGENPHQSGALYTSVGQESWWDSCVQLGGKAMSYLNVLDAEAAWSLVCELGSCYRSGADAAPGDGKGDGASGGEAAAVVVKHANPCGVAVANSPLEAYRRAHACDPVSAFGGIVAISSVVDLPVAESVSQIFTEVLLAPDYTHEALKVLRKKKALRVLKASPPKASLIGLRSVAGGFLVQTSDGWGDCFEPPRTPLPEADSGSNAPGNASISRVAVDLRVVGQRQPSAGEWRDMLFAWRVVAAVSSNAIVVAKDRCAVGIGAGQPNRRDSGAIAARKAAGRGKGGAYASDAFFPFPDGLDGALEAGCTAVISPGGSIRDAEVIAAADDANLAMVFTGLRRFRH